MKKVLEVLKREIPSPKMSERHRLISRWMITIIFTALLVILSFQIYRLFNIHLSILPKLAVLEYKVNLQGQVEEEIRIIKFYVFQLLTVEFLLFFSLFGFVSGLMKGRKKVLPSEK